MRIFVGNLSFSATEATVRALFEAHGPVDQVSIVTDRDTGRSRGFGFVEMASDADAQRAIAALNGREDGGRSLTVNEARPKAAGGGSRGGFGGDRGGSGSRRREPRW